MLHIFFLVFQRDNSLLSLLVFSAHFCFASNFFLIENTENTQKKTARTIPSDILALLSFFHSHSHFFILLPQAPTLFFFSSFPPRFSLAVRFSPPSVGWWRVPPARR